MGNYSEAKSYFESATAINPTHVPSLQRLVSSINFPFQRRTFISSALGNMLASRQRERERERHGTRFQCHQPLLAEPFYEAHCDFYCDSAAISRTRRTLPSLVDPVDLAQSKHRRQGRTSMRGINSTFPCQGMVHHQSGDGIIAEKVLREAINIDPTDHVSW